MMILPLKSIRVTTEAKHKPTKIKFYLKKKKIPTLKKTKQNLLKNVFNFFTDGKK